MPGGRDINPSMPTIDVGNRSMYVDSQGNLHSSASETVAANMRSESDQSRGSSGGCAQDAANVREKDDG